MGDGEREWNERGRRKGSIRSAGKRRNVTIGTGKQKREGKRKIGREREKEKPVIGKKEVMKREKGVSYWIETGEGCNEGER